MSMTDKWKLVSQENWGGEAGSSTPKRQTHEMPVHSRAGVVIGTLYRESYYPAAGTADPSLQNLVYVWAP